MNSDIELHKKVKNTVKPVEDNHSCNHSQVVDLDKWLSHKTPPQNDH